MPLVAVVLDEVTLARGSDAQRAEWDANARELMENGASQVLANATLLVRATEDGFVLDFHDDDGSSLGSVRIDQEMLADHVQEYLDVVNQITDTSSLNQMEALDMAKKVTHDRAGRVIKRALRDFGFDLETSRRLFTLLLSLKIDTTRLPALRAHRRVQ